MGTRSRTLKYLPGHALRFGVAAVARDDTNGDVVEAVCLFCQHFGREQRADKKRKSASTVKRFRDSFRPDQYTQHHQLQHPTQWERYKACSDEDKRRFFPQVTAIDTVPVATKTGPEGPKRTLLPKAEERGRCFDLKASIVEVVAVLAVGFGPVESTVKTRDRLLFQYMTHHDYDGELPSSCPGWTPPPDTFQSCYVVQTHPPVYRVVVFSRSQMDLVVDMAADGLSAAQISRCVQVFRRHAPMLLSDLVQNSKKTEATSKRGVAMAAERAEERAKKRFRVEDDVSPEYDEQQTAEFVRLAVAASMSVIAGLLEESWAFSLELRTVDRHLMFSYLDVRVKLYCRVGGMWNAHLLAIPRYVGKCDAMMFQTLDRVLTALLPEWRKKLLGVTIDGDVPIPARIIDLTKHFQNAASGSVLYRTNNSSHALQHMLQTFYASLSSGRFLQTLKMLSGYVRDEPILGSEMERYPGYRDVLGGSMFESTKSPMGFGQEVDMLMVHNGMLRTHFSDISSATPAPPMSWWVMLELVHWVTARANAVFEVLEKRNVAISQQAAVVASLAEECITGFHAQFVDEEHSSTRTHSNDFVSSDGRIVMSSSAMLGFVIDSSQIAPDLMKNGGSATVISVSADLAAGAVDMVSSLVEFSVSLKKQDAACANSTSTTGSVSHTVAVTDTLPPVLPHELAHLCPAEFVELLQAHDVAARGTLTDADIIAIRKEHELLRRSFTEDEGIRYALGKCTQDTSFDVAWSLVDCRFKCLEAFAGGLATARPLDTVAFSDQRARDLVVRTKDLEEARLLLADFELESALHAQQFQSLTKLQEEIYDRELSENRSRLVHTLQAVSDKTN
ncbi:hypothetical protein PF005_g4807 [Phytophthora fragariae]|uniref:Uncharacterized protein n=1 Tax=Phytophthora fragariae TaxID=53985 RepID=A0A6A4DYS9_9STRA|nr:hypothetical protein PF003_g19224 [Phytophthora fragariae]KAE8945134.1 hypothetical protein PF009_g5208 [Phytophthora fragariae]KAE9127064.1 hypothetical protein PF007_g5740 [Phytophthora fragariae]KAE9136819.1 hypothetical protein PF010_g1564 [Phytophthora fragariae]KAE9151681.1 hypothetical protein PF006_g4037 [Phytophthora fragariae]